MNQFYYSNNTNFTGHVQRNTVFENTVHPKQIVEQIPMTKEIGKMLPEFGLVNMNGRMYDSMLARMLSPDPFVTNPSLGQDYNRYSYFRNNPIKYTDPSGYIVNGGNNVFFNSYNLHAGMISKEREWWNNHLDYMYHRGDYASGGGFGGTNATFAIGGSVLNVGSVAGGFLGDGSMLTQQGKDFVKSHTGSTPVNKDGVWGSWQDGHYYELHNYTMEFKEGEFTSFNTMALVTTSRFVPFSNNQSSASGGGEHLIGPTLILLGQPLNALKPAGVLGSKPGSSIASYTLSKAFPQTFTGVLGKQTGTKIAKSLGTNVIGRAAGRLVPYVGWTWTLWEIAWYLSENYGPSKWFVTEPPNSTVIEYMRENGMLNE